MGEAWEREMMRKNAIMSLFWNWKCESVKSNEYFLLRRKHLWNAIQNKKRKEKYVPLAHSRQYAQAGRHTFHSEQRIFAIKFHRFHMCVWNFLRTFIIILCIRISLWIFVCYWECVIAIWYHEQKQIKALFRWWRFWYCCCWCILKYTQSGIKDEIYSKCNGHLTNKRNWI